jgi:hypothetical protein
LDVREAPSLFRLSLVPDCCKVFADKVFAETMPRRLRIYAVCAGGDTAAARFCMISSGMAALASSRFILGMPPKSS